jgi:hypothetical protein
MTLNWTPEGLFNIISGSILLILSLKVYTSPKTRKIASIKYLATAFLFGSAYNFFLFSAILFLSELFTILYSLMSIGIVLFIVVAINYIVKDRLYSTNLIIIIIISTLLVYSMFQQPVVSIVLIDGFYTTIALGVFAFFSELLIVIGMLITFYWGLKTFLYSPPFIKKEARIFFLGITIMSIISFFIYFLYFFFSIFLILYSVIFSLGALIFMIAIIREPKLLYILPFEVNRILVKDREGFPLFDHDWSESNISDNIFSGFVNAVQIMSEEVINKGGILDIILSDGILILRESEFITVGLVASKPSKLLRESLINFSDEFQMKFMKLLKTNCREIDKYDDAYELIEKYFSNFPSKLVSGKDHPLFLTMKRKKLTPELENKMREIFDNEQEFEHMKEEIKKFPESAAWHFLKFYQENRDAISNTDGKSLEDKNS